MYTYGWMHVCMYTYYGLMYTCIDGCIHECTYVGTCAGAGVWGCVHIKLKGIAVNRVNHFSSSR